MKFIVDEQLPHSLAKWLNEQGHDAVRIAALEDGTRFSDTDIATRSMLELRTVISKDSDFFVRFMIKKEPYKLLYITTGNIRNAELLHLFTRNFDSLLQDLTDHHVVEMSNSRIIVHA